ncbi:MAG: hypothetical protein RSB82_04445 [Victivallaceae bacterium]
MSVNSVSQSAVINNESVEKGFAALKFKVCLFLILGFCLLIVAGGLLGFISFSFNFIPVSIGLLCLSLLFLGLACVYRFIFSKKYIIAKSFRLLEENFFKQRFKECLKEAKCLEHDLDKERNDFIEGFRLVNKVDAASDFISEDTCRRFEVLQRKYSTLNEKQSCLKKEYFDFVEETQGVNRFLGTSACIRDNRLISNLTAQLLIRMKKLLKSADGIALCLQATQKSLKKKKARLATLDGELSRATQQISCYLRHEKSGKVQAGVLSRDNFDFHAKTSIDLGAEIAIGRDYIDRACRRINDCECQLRNFTEKREEWVSDLKLFEERLLKLVPESEEHLRLGTIIIPGIQRLIALIDHCTSDVRRLRSIYKEKRRCVQSWVLIKKGLKFAIDQRLELVTNNIRYREGVVIRGYSSFADNAYSREDTGEYESYLRTLDKETLESYLETIRYRFVKDSLTEEIDKVNKISEKIRELMLQQQRWEGMLEQVDLRETLLKPSEIMEINMKVRSASAKLIDKTPVTMKEKIACGLLMMERQLKALKRKLTAAKICLSDTKKECFLLSRVLVLKREIDEIIGRDNPADPQGSGLTGRMLQLRAAAANYNAWLHPSGN